MKWLKKLFSPRFTPDPRRWLLVDVETSGLDPSSDRLLAIAGVALVIGEDFKNISIEVTDSFEVVLKQQTPSDKDNILLHGIGVQAQREGEDPAVALQAFIDWVGTSPLLAFHAAFDEAMIQRACRQHVGRSLPNAWLDIEPLAAHVYRTEKGESLDVWMDRLDVQCARRHQAIADVWASAEVLLKLWPALSTEAKDFAKLKHLENGVRWLRRRPASR
jgi:DNA polymerase-3 subunit epsilon